MNQLQHDEQIPHPGDTDDGGGQYLTFVLDGEEYGIEILRVQEIKGWEATTPMPNTPDYVLGILNLRGAIVPVIDLRKRFNLDEIPYGPTTVVIVVKMHHADQERTMGLVVDGVADVYRLEDDQIQDSPELGNAVDTDFVRGLASVDKKMVILLEVDRLFDVKVLGDDHSKGKASSPDAIDKQDES